jgi:predicted peroxiredoxin
MRGVAIIVTQQSVSAWRGALSIASATAAAGASARVHLHEAAVALIAKPLIDPLDREYSAAGLPTLAELFDTALALGVTLSACQSGLVLVGAAADTLDPRIVTDGLLNFLSSVKNERLISV